MLLLVPQELRVPGLEARFQELMDEAGVSLAELLEGLAVEREAIHLICFAPLPQAAQLSIHGMGKVIAYSEP